MKAVKFDHYGDIDARELRDVPTPSPGPRDVQVEVQGGRNQPRRGNDP
jgi:NADPH:quinone reductase-like Zn-dependent oxidoreductase